MSIWNKILLGFVLLASLGFMYVAARALKTHQHWRNLTVSLEKKIVTTREETRKIIEGDENGKRQDGSLASNVAEVQLRRALINRGRVWLRCEHRAGAAKAGKDGATAQIAVAVTPADGILGITDKTLLYAFEEGAAKDNVEVQKEIGSYVGEFLVSELTDNSVVLEPAMKLTDREMDRVKNSKSAWTLYETMPVDRHEVFADLTDDDKKTLLPETTLAEYKKDGQPADANDPEECKVEQPDGSVKYVRKLRDYRQLFKTYHAERTFFVDTYESLKRDTTYIQESLADAKLQFQFAEKEVAGLSKGLAVAQRERQAVVSHTAAVAAKLKQYQAMVATQIRENLEIGAQIARIQWEAARRIDERTRLMVPVARTGTGAN